MGIVECWEDWICEAVYWMEVRWIESSMNGTQLLGRLLMGVFGTWVKHRLGTFRDLTKIRAIFFGHLVASLSL